MKMPVHHESFARSSREAPQRSVGCLQGPYTRPGRKLVGRVIEGTYYVAGCALLVSLLFAPRMWAKLVGV